MSATSKVENETVPAPSNAERRALIERVARSAQLARSVRLRDFLQYVGYGSLDEGAAEIHEHAIGVHVFGRSPDYDRSQDNIVRVNATELRRRIDRYFETEGVDEPLIFSIPRGRYTPVFEWRALAASKPAALHSMEPEQGVPVAAVSPAPPELSSKPSLPWLWMATTLILLTLCCFFWWQNRTLRAAADVWSQKPAVARFWTGFISTASDTEIILPDASVSMSDEITNQSLSLWDYIHRNFPGSGHGEHLSAERRQDLDTIFSHNLVTLGDFKAAQQFLALTPLAASFHLSLARFFEADSINHANVIVIGGRKANPWAALFDEQLNYTLENRDGHTSICIVSRHPAAGQPESYCPTIGQNDITAYSVVAFVPNLGRTGKVLLLAGTDSDATAAAAQFMTSEDGLNELRAGLHTARIGYFEALLKTSSLHGAPFSAQLIAVRPR